MSNINTTLNDVFRSTPLGDVRNAIGTTFYGINHRGTPQPVPINTDQYGLVFFTRPGMNMSTDNIRAERKFIPLLTKEPASIQRIIRCYLDPRLAWSVNSGISSPYVDNKSAFIPILSNHALTVSGWPDPVTDTYTSKPGAYKEVFGFTDSSIEIFSAYDMTASFRNMIGDPITMLYYTWLVYKSNVFKGNFVPYPDFLIKNEIDYHTRIYRLVLDRTKRFVQKIACTGAAEPVSVNLGAAFNYDFERPFNESAERIEMQFRCYGAMYNDPIIVHQFNKVVTVFNPDMKPQSNGLPGSQFLPTDKMIAIPQSALSYFNGMGYPWINPDTMELLWYVSRAEFNAKMNEFNSHARVLDPEGRYEPLRPHIPA